MELVHIPGETDDQIGLWWEEHKAFLCADDLYEAFPNLYAIRGTTNRSLKQWIDSMDIMLEYEPELLVPSHTRPVVGKGRIMTLITEYRDAIQYVHDQTVRLINQGRHPDEIAKKLVLPEKLADNSYLKEAYGTVAWSSKSVFMEYLGWFSGNPVDLNPLTISERAKRLANLIGIGEMLEAAKDALDDEDYQWALELSTYVADQAPDDTDARDIRVEALTALASLQISTNGKNYYLTSAKEVSGDVIVQPPKEAERNKSVEMLPLHISLGALSTMFDPEKCDVADKVLCLDITEPSSHHYIHIRNSVAIVKNVEYPKICNARILAKESDWKKVMVSEIVPGDLLVEGSLSDMQAIFCCLDMAKDSNCQKNKNKNKDKNKDKNKHKNKQANK